MSDIEIKKLRDQINKLDDDLLKILDSRAQVVIEIGKLKDQTKSVVDENREKAVLDRILSLSKGSYSKDSIIRIWRELFEASSKLQINLSSAISTKRSIANIDIYKGGESKIKGVSKVIKLSSNENPYGPSKNIENKINAKNLNRYPEINGDELRKELANFHNIKSNQIILGCGSDETLLFAALSFCQFGDEVIHSDYGFEMYPIITKIVGAVSKIVKEIDYKISIKSIIEEISPATKLIYIANPNNPTGSYLTKKEIRELMMAIPKNIIVVLDGAYAEYVEQDDYDSDFTLVREFENIILTRTFSKAYGLAGIRLGWCYSSPKVAEILKRVKGPFNTNSIAQAMAITAIQDQAHIKMVVDNNKNNKLWFEAELNKLNIKVLPSFANFSFIELDVKNANLIADLLESEAIIVRRLDSYSLPQCLRITIGTIEDMKKIINILRIGYEPGKI